MSRETDLPRGAVTGIGSVPESEIGPALIQVFQNAPHYPYLPELPQPSEALLSLPELGWPPEHLQQFEQSCLRHSIRGVKAQICGPVTLRRYGGPLGDSSIQRLKLRIQDLLSLLEGCGAGQRWLFFDEPGLESWEQLPEGVDLFREFFAQVREAGALVGLHCCGRIPWDLVQLILPDALAFDVTLEGEEGAEASHRYWLQGGRLALGLVRTDLIREVASSPEASQELSATNAVSIVSQWAQWYRHWNLPELAARSWVTPACGLGTHSLESAHEIWQTTRQVSERVAQIAEKA